MKKVIIVVIGYCFLYLHSAQLVMSQGSQLFINEFMASNATTIRDDADEYDDWIEIYNASNIAISLQGYYLTDDLKNPTKWAFPNITIAAQGYLLIWADNDVHQPGLHANFKLSADGEQIGLHDGSTFIDQVIFGAQRTDVSYGRKQDGAQEWVFFQAPHNPPTPGAKNVYRFIPVLNPPHFYPGEGFYQGSIWVTLSTRDEDAAIHYTLNGTVPTSSSPRYTNPIPIATTTTIRAICYKYVEPGDTLVSEVATMSYLLNVDNSMPLIVIACDPAGHDQIYYSAAPGEDRDAIPARYKYFDQQHVLRGDLPINLSIRGGYSVFSPKKSYKVTYPDKNFSFNVFDQPYNYPLPPNPQVSFHSLNFAGMAADYSLIRNYLAFHLLQIAGGYAPQVSFARLFINGEDRGIYIPMERVDQWFVRSRDFAPGDYDIIKTGSAHECYLTLDNENGAHFELKEGDFAAFNEFLIWLNERNHTFQELSQKIDIQSFLYYDLICRFSNNKDSYDINYYLIKNREQSQGKWIILHWDADEGFGWDNQVASYWYPYNMVYHQLHKTDEYNFLFLNTLADLINTKWSQAEVSKLVQYMEELFQVDNSADEFIWNELWYAYAAGWIPDFETAPNYNPLSRYKQFDYIKQWAGERINYLRRQTWETGTAVLTINPPVSGKGSVQLNSLRLTAFPWTGTYFKEVPISVSAIPDPGYHFIGWSDSALQQKSDISLVLKTNYQLSPIFQADLRQYEIVINEINYNSARNFDPGDWIELYNPSKDAIDLSGWHLKDDAADHNFRIPDGTAIAPNGFLIVCQKKRDFNSLFPQVNNYVGDFAFGLSSQGDEVRIYNPLDILIDSVKYQSIHPWPVQANGGGSTLELIDPVLDNTLAENWQASLGYGTPGAANSTGWHSIQDNSEDPTVPSQIRLFQNYPNPFNQGTQISFQTPNACHVKLTVFNLKGERIRTLLNEIQSAGNYRITWDGKSDNGLTTPTGIYILKMQTDRFQKDMKMIQIK